MRGVWRNWRERHRHRVSVALHAIGIPMTVAAVPLAVLGRFGWAAGLFVGGYALQFVGHGVEGNDAGEIILVKRLLGRPFVAVAPRTPPSECQHPRPDVRAGEDD